MQQIHKKGIIEFSFLDKYVQLTTHLRPHWFSIPSHWQLLSFTIIIKGSGELINAYVACAVTLGRPYSS
jgi:hypothetical protein